KDSFIFSFEDGDDINDHILSRVVKKDYAIFNDHTYGPSFGGADLILRGDIGHYMKDSYEKQIRDPPSEFPEPGTICNCCGKTIRGMRWRCEICMNCNICQDCKSYSDNYYHSHDSSFFRPIGRDLRNAICDYCGLYCMGAICYKCANNAFYVKEYELFQVIKR
ncbi:hypothetical protein RhiirA1_492211, partial [Rhizophagus irregularis]